jgi:Cytochrome c554 and c-prime
MFRFLSIVLAVALAGAANSSGADKPLSKEPPKPVAVKPFDLGAPDVVLLVSGGDGGMLEVCDCPGKMPGGLSRRSGLAISYRAAFPNVVMLDQGNGFVRGGDSLINDYHMHGLRKIGYDAVVLGEYEWGAPGTRLQTILTEGPLTYLATTVQEKAPAPGKKPLLVAPVVERTFGAAKLAIVSDLRAEWKPMISQARLGELAFDKDALAAQVERLHKEGRFVLVVCHGDKAALQQTVASCPGADLFLRGLRSEPLKTLDTIDGRPLLTLWGHEHVGALAMKFSPEGKLDKLEYRRETVGPEWPIDERLLQTYRDYCKVAMFALLAEKPKPGPMYFASLQCGTCHKSQYANWQTTKHSAAYKTLVREKRTDDPACLSCHTTGLGTIKGFITPEKTPMLAGVNCQDCHAMDAGAHLKKPKAYPKPVTEATCRVCHTEVTDPKFDFATRTKEYHCPKGKPPLPGVASRPATAPATEPAEAKP